MSVDMSKSFSAKELSVLNYLSLWAHCRPPVSVARALVLPSEDWVFPGLAFGHGFVSSEPQLVRELIEYLGGTRLTRHDYVLTYIVPHLAEFINDTQIQSIQNLHSFIVRNLPSRPDHAKSRLSKAPLIPDRNRKLRCSLSHSLTMKSQYSPPLLAPMNPLSPILSSIVYN